MERARGGGDPGRAHHRRGVGQLKVDPALTIKSLVFMADDRAVLALVRGDHALHERKLARALGGEARPAHPEEVTAHLGVAPGSIGPVRRPG